MNLLTFEGLEELKDELRRLPAELRDEGNTIGMNRAERARAAIDADYPRRAGHLKKGLKIRVIASGPFGFAIEVLNTDKDAMTFEIGSQARHTTLGANRGSMPAGHVFVPHVQRHRRAMFQELKDMLVRHGLVVTGDAR